MATASDRQDGRRSVALAVALVIGVAAALRLAFIDALPQGAYSDEILTLHNAIELLGRPLDPFGWMPLVSDRPGWVHTSHLYLYFNAAIVRLTGVSYLSMKLFSIVPGVATCLFVALAALRLFDRRTALSVAFLFACAHWHVRLSRYGWDVSFSLMCLAAGLYFVLVALQRRHAGPAFAAGIIGGIGLHSYIGSRAAVGGLVLLLVIEALRSGGRTATRTLLSYAAGLALMLVPYALHFYAHPEQWSVRTQRLSVFSRAAYDTILLDNVVGHALMFHATGGAYARDNIPGLPMLDALTALLFVLGLWRVWHARRAAVAPSVVVLFVCLLLPGLLSVSQEGPPYVYRTAAVLVPTFLIVGYGVEWGRHALSTFTRRFGRPLVGEGVAAVALLVAFGLNLHAYFGREAENRSAARVMAWVEPLVGRAIAGTDLPAYVIVPRLLEGRPVRPPHDEPYYGVNRDRELPLATAKLAVLYFSGRYDLGRPLEENVLCSRIVFVGDEDAEMAPAGPALVVAERESPILRQWLARHPATRITRLSDNLGEPALLAATLR